MFLFLVCKVYFIYSRYESLMLYVIRVVFSQEVGCLFTFLMLSFKAQKFLILMSPTYQSSLLSLVLLVSYLRNHCLTQDHENLLLYFLKEFYSFISYIYVYNYFELIFVHDVI